MGTQPYCPSLSGRKGLKIPCLRDPSGRSCHLAFFSSSGSIETSDLKTSSNIKCSFCWKDRCLYFCWLTLDSGGANDRRSRTGWPVFCDWTLVHNRERNRVETQRRLPMQKLLALLLSQRTSRACHHHVPSGNLISAWGTTCTSTGPQPMDCTHD